MILIDKKRILFLILLVLSSCNSQFETYVAIKNEKERISSDAPVYFYFPPKQTLPDSAEYVGDFSVEFKDNYYHVSDKRYDDYDVTVLSFWGKKNANFTVRDILINASKDAGANLILFNNSNEPKEYFNYASGKFFRIKDIGVSNLNIESIKKLWKEKTPDKYEGIYQVRQFSILNNMNKDIVRYALVKTAENKYSLIYLDGFDDCDQMIGFTSIEDDWKEGDVMAYLETTDNPFLFNTNKFDLTKYLELNCVSRFDGNTLRIYSKSGLEFLQKVYPNKSEYESLDGSLTGFAISGNKIITCFHGTTEIGSRIFVRGINGNFDTKYEAIVEKVDRENDIAVLSLVDKSIQLTGTPLTFSEVEKQTADEVFVLGYPIASVMGEEIKLTNGLISANSGMGGNMRFYQISAPTQPGNSGSPLFDSEGNVIGVCNSGIPSANNVGYCIKQHNVNTFLKNNGYSFASTNNTLKNLSMQEKVKSLKNSIYLIELISNNPMKYFSVDNKDDVDTEEFNLNEDD